MVRFISMCLIISAAFTHIAYGQELPIIPGDPIAPPPSSDPAKLNLLDAIKKKTDVLQDINRQIEENQKNLIKTEEQKQTLQGEIKKFDYRISQLNLSIKSSEISLEKLGLEVQSLQDNIAEKERLVELKKVAIVNFIREFQERSDENILLTFLKHKTLAEGFSESQTLISLNENLTLEIQDLTRVKNELGIALDTTSKKKNEVAEESQTLQSRRTIASGTRQEKNVFLAQTKEQEKIYQSQLKELEKQQEAISDEIEKIEDELRKNFDEGLLPLERGGFFAWPVLRRINGGTGHVTQHFGERSNLYRGKPHNGLDIGTPIGTPILAADEGEVVAVDNNDRSRRWEKYQYGLYILVKHGSNLTTLYAHLSKTSVRVGQTVKRGETIGYSGNSGYSTGPHLHFGVYWSPSVLMKSIPPAAGLVPVGVLVNPEKYL